MTPSAWNSTGGRGPRWTRTGARTGAEGASLCSRPPLADVRRPAVSHRGFSVAEPARPVTRSFGERGDATDDTRRATSGGYDLRQRLRRGPPDLRSWRASHDQRSQFGSRPALGSRGRDGRRLLGV